MSESFSVQPLEADQYEVTTTLPDSLGLLSLITGLFASHDLSILSGTIETSEKKAKDTFRIQTSQKVDWDGLQRQLEELSKQLAKGEVEQVRSQVNHEIIRLLRATKKEPTEGLGPIQLEVDQTGDPHYTIVDIEADDTPAFLYELTNALSLLGINIARMDIQTEGEKVRDRLWVTTETGEKITSEKKLKALQWAVLLVKQFTHLLPNVPDPKAALEQMTLFGKDVLLRSDFNEILLSLKRSKTLEDLSKVLGTTKFLWEEFVREQHESIFPIFANHEILKIKKNRKGMSEELEDRLRLAASFEEKEEALNEYKDREMFRIDLRHILGRVSYLGEFAEEFSDLAEAVIEHAYHIAFERTLKDFPRPMASEHEKSEGLVFALGKFGGRELGYASDLELMILYTDDVDSSSAQSQENLKFYSELVRHFRKLIHARTAGIFELDLRLRPHGKDGPLAVSMNLFKNYYAPQGEAWNFERQALVKLRPVMGPEHLTDQVRAWRDAFVYSAEPFDLQDFLHLRERQQRELVKPGELSSKQSAGGLLDVEYLLQVLQIAYGRKQEESIRSPNSLKAMRTLWQLGVLTQKEFQDLRAAYLFLRSLINALRIFRGHAKDLTVPKKDSEAFVILARRMGYSGEDDQIREDFEALIQRHMKTAHALFGEKIKELQSQDWITLKTPRTQVVSALKISLDDLLRGEVDGEKRKEIAQLGFYDLDAVLARFKRLCPIAPAFEAFAKAMDQAWSLWPSLPNPDRALYFLEQFADRYEPKEKFWDLLLSSPEGLHHHLQLFGASQYLAQILIDDPSCYNLIHDSTEWRLEDFPHPESLKDLEALQSFRHIQTLKIALGEFLGKVPLDQVYGDFSSLAEFVLEIILKQTLPAEKICLLGLGKLGGEELNFSSDVDLMFVARDGEELSELALPIQKFLGQLKKGSLQEALYRTDLRLRPNGDKGALVMDQTQTQAYYQKEAAPWEYQMLLKARPIAGAKDFGQAFLDTCQPLVYPKTWKKEALDSIRQVKKRYEAMTEEKGETQTHLKLGRGGIRDIEFSVQMLQLQRGHEFPELRTPNIFKAFEAIEKLKLLNPKECETLHQAYLLLRRIENRLQLEENRQVFSLPLEDVRKMRSLALSLGFEGQGTEKAEALFASELESLRSRVREIFEKVFF